jgi:MFS family permease
MRTELTVDLPRPQLLTRGFVVLCAATALTYAHHALLTPVLPLFIKSHGGTASLVGFVAASFNVTSFLLRPLIGRAIDNWSARAVMGLGASVLAISSLGYIFYNALLIFLIRAVHGTGWAAYNTVAKVLVSTTAPVERRGEAAGYFSMAQNVATALVPAIAILLLNQVGFNGVFVISAIGGFLATVATLYIPAWPERANARRSRESFFHDLVERSVLIPSVLEFLTKVTQPAVGIFIPLYALHRGISTESLPYYYLCYGLVGIGARGLLGSVSDRIGRQYMIGFGAAASIVALLIISQAHGILLLTFGGTLYGLATAAFAPSVMALAIDVAPRDRVGSAMATYSMAFQLAQGVGGLLSGILIDSLGYVAMYLIMTVAPLSAVLFLAKNRRVLRVKHAAAKT